MIHLKWSHVLAMFLLFNIFSIHWLSPTVQTKRDTYTFFPIAFIISLKTLSLDLEIQDTDHLYLYVLHSVDKLLLLAN